MKTRIISTLALVAGVLLSGCTREDMPEGGAPGDGNRVVFTLAGITPQQQNGRTRAAGDNNASATTERRNPTPRPLPMPRRK